MFKMLKSESYEKFNGTVGYGSPCHGERLLSDPNSSTHTGVQLDGTPRCF